MLSIIYLKNNLLIINKILSITLLVFIIASCKKEPEKTYLFNGSDLNQWDTYLGIPDPTQDVPQLQKNEDGTYTNSFGLNNDPVNVFSIVEEDGENVIRISGYIWGGLITKNEYSNYRLHLEFKWGEEKYPPRENLERNSGLCYHSIGEYGAFWSYWMRSVELEIKENGLGDIVRVDTVSADVETSINKTVSWPQLRYYKGGKKYTLNSTLYMIRASENYEKPYGEWNTVDLYVFENNAAHIINDSLALIATNLTQSVEKDNKPLTYGKIQLQSEGAEIYYKNIWIENINEFPYPLD